MWLHRCNGGACYLLLLSPGQLDETALPQVLHVELTLNCHKTFLDLCWLNPQILTSERELALHIQREELRLRVLEHRPDPLSDVIGLIMRDDLTI